MSLIKLARLSSEDLYARATSSALKKHPKEIEPDWKAINKQAVKIKNRYNKFADYIRNRNIKRGLIGVGLVGGLIGSGYLYKKHKKENI